MNANSGSVRDSERACEREGGEGREREGERERERREREREVGTNAMA